MSTSTEPRGAGESALYRLLAWLSPAFPIGAFSYSHGIEAAAENGAVRDRESLQHWVAAIVIYGSGRMDADILRDAYRAVADDDPAAFEAANRRGVAYRATAELALESAQQGAAFSATHEAAWTASKRNSSLLNAGRGQGEEGVSSDEILAPLGPTLSGRPAGGEGNKRDIDLLGEGVCYAAVFGTAAARANIALEDALLGYLQAFAANLISAGLRLGIIGQTDGQRILAALEPDIIDAARAAVTRGPADFGSATFAVDLASVAHETQYSRLFRS
jgi:urease accessory protein